MLVPQAVSFKLKSSKISSGHSTAGSGHVSPAFLGLAVTLEVERSGLGIPSPRPTRARAGRSASRSRAHTPEPSATGPWLGPGGRVPVRLFARPITDRHQVTGRQGGVLRGYRSARPHVWPHRPVAPVACAAPHELDCDLFSVAASTRARSANPASLPLVPAYLGQPTSEPFATAREPPIGAATRSSRLRRRCWRM